MKINELCKRVGITKDNIRFYEKKGLLKPARDAGNNYREYDENDVVLLERIRLLRSLGIPIADIRQIIEGDLSLEEAMQMRLSTIEAEKKQLGMVRRVCTAIAESGTGFDGLDAEKVTASEPGLKDLLADIGDKDTEYLDLTERDFDRTIAGMLIAGYVFGALILLILGNLLGHAGDDIAAYNDTNEVFSRAFIALYVAMSVAVSVVSVWSSKARTQLITYIVAAACLAPPLWGLFAILRINTNMGVIVLAVQTFMVVLLYLLRRKSRRFTEYLRYPVAVAAAGCICEAMLFAAVLGRNWQTVFVAALTGILLFLTAITWSVNGSSRFRLTMFHAMVTASRMLMPGAMFTHYYGQQSSWRRGTEEPEWFRGN